MGKKRIKSRAAATKIQRRELVDWGLLARRRISGGLTCETLRSSALLVLKLRLAGEVERDLDVLCIVNSEYVETLTPGKLEIVKVKVLNVKVIHPLLFSSQYALHLILKIAEILRKCKSSCIWKTKSRLQSLNCLKTVVDNLNITTQWWKWKESRCICMKVKIKGRVAAVYDQLYRCQVPRVTQTIKVKTKQEET